MRMTVEIDDHLRAKLLELAARRGLKGFSSIVQEAIELYLEHVSSRQDRVQKALSSLGSMSKKSADELEQSIKSLREQWR